MNFNEKLITLRKSKGLSQEELGNELKVSRQTISKWESCQSYPDFQRLVLLSDYFGLTLYELVKDIDVQEVREKNLNNEKLSAIYNDDVQIWNVEQSEENKFTATYEVDQQIKEGDQTKAFSATYTVTVHVDADGNMVITKNPTLAPAHQKSTYEPKVQEADGTVDAETMQDATPFLETFFKLYPTATEKELAYYVQGNVLEPINGDYLYSELINPIFAQDGENVRADQRKAK